MTKPDFIIIGAMKSATSTLHTQLSMQDGIFMSTPKEPNYFSNDEIYARGESWYKGLFKDANPNDICGESSTHYTKLPTYPHTIERMSQQLSNPKLVYVMRDPIDRLISHYIHQWSQNVFKCDINEAIDTYEELIAYSCYAMQLEPYIKQFGCENIIPIFNEGIRKDSQKQLEKVAHFIGYESKTEWVEEVAPQNVSRDRIRAFAGYSLLIESKLMMYLRRTLVPQSIRDKIKNKLTMTERPVIDEPHLEKLTRLFNEDLAKLGDWFNVDLNCDSYHDIAQNQDLVWEKTMIEKNV